MLKTKALSLFIYASITLGGAFIPPNTMAADEPVLGQSVKEQTPFARDTLQPPVTFLLSLPKNRGILRKKGLMLN